MPEVIEGTGIVDRIVTWAEVDDALFFYDIDLKRFVKQTGMSRRYLQRLLETEEPAPGWVVIVLMMYERFPELRRLNGLPGVDGIHPDEEVTPELLRSALSRRAVSPEAFTRHARMAKIAVEHMLDGSRPVLRPWVRWVLLMYDLWPEMRTLRQPLHLPHAKWPSEDEDLT
jgi:hypothetical protein